MRSKNIRLSDCAYFFETKLDIVKKILITYNYKICSDLNCSHKENLQLKTNFYKRKIGVDGYNTRCKACLSKCDLEYYKLNIDKGAYWSSKYHASKLQRTPKWANMEKIKKFYIQAHELTESTGIEHAVDHIIPLQGEFISGLHIETNLQILTKSKNSSKSNKFVPYSITYNKKEEDIV